jgi:hypothetical protein
LIDAGLDLTRLFGAAAGVVDFSGEPVPSSGGYAVGAEEFGVAEAC